MRNFDNIINEEIQKFILSEGALDDIRGVLRKYRSENPPKPKEEIRRERKLKKQAEKDKRGRKKIRKTVKGGKKYYDYDDYEFKNRKVGKGDFDSIKNTVDMENTDIAAVARTVFPDHTDEGAQSQLRKVLTGERPMTKVVASKLQKLISRGKIAVK